MTTHDSDATTRRLRSSREPTTRRLRTPASDATTVALYEPGAGRPPARPARRPAGPLAWLMRFVVGTVVLGVLVVGGTAFRVWQVARVDDRRPVDAVVVLGAAQYDGDPSSIFASRLKHAKSLFDDGVAPRIVTTGGSRPGDVTTEAEAGRRYLIEHGVPAASVIAVPEGNDTLASLEAVAVEARKDGWSSAMMVSDPWHSLRARTMARDEGLTAWTSPTRSGPVVQTRETQVRYIVRETGATLFYRLTHASADASYADELSVG
jgi:uncharacterized SAM-binding protein YcdF (DUF218 family)